MQWVCLNLPSQAQALVLLRICLQCLTMYRQQLSEKSSREMLLGSSGAAAGYQDSSRV